jgi:hypothetical protein
MNMWNRTMMKSLFNWWILKGRGSVRRRLWRINMWRRTMMKSFVQLVNFEEEEG